MDEHPEARGLARRTLIVTSVAGLLLLIAFGVGRLASVWLLFFAGIVLAAFLRAIAGWLARHTPVSTGVALVLTVLGLLGIVGGAVAVLIPRVVDQFGQLVSQLSELARSSRRVRATSRLAEECGQRVA